MTSSVLCEGSIITGARIADSIIGIRAVVQKGASISRSMVMGANHFESLEELERFDIPIGIGRDCELRNAIVDFNARIGDGCRLVNENGVEEADGEGWAIRGGVVVVEKDAVIPPGTVV